MSRYHNIYCAIWIGRRMARTGRQAGRPRPAFIALPQNDGKEFAVTEEPVAEFESLYPAVGRRRAEEAGSRGP